MNEIKASSFISLCFLSALYSFLHLYFRLISISGLWTGFARLITYQTSSQSIQVPNSRSLIIGWKKVCIFTSKILPLNPQTVRELHLNWNSKGSHIPAGVSFFFRCCEQSVSFHGSVRFYARCHWLLTHSNFTKMKVWRSSSTQEICRQSCYCTENCHCRASNKQIFMTFQRCSDSYAEDGFPRGQK